MQLPGPWLWLALYVLMAAAEYLLLALNLGRLVRAGGRVPPELAGQVDADVLARTSRYTADKIRWTFATTIYQQALLITFFFAGGLAYYQTWTASWHASFIVHGLGFGLGLGLAWSVLQMPFELFRVFRLEQAYGFNTQDLRQWCLDQLKGLAVAGVLGGGLLAGVLGLVQGFPNAWWLWVWGFYLLFTCFVVYISPYVLEPLFNKFTPVAEPLGGEARALASRAGIRVDKIQQMDASRRSRHSNAYFSGLGRVKRIVLFDTLLAKLETPEILAVLAHEAGHWKKHHVLKGLGLSALISLIVLYGAFWVLRTHAVAASFGLPAGAFAAQAAAVLFLFSFLGFPFTPLLTAWSRRQEREADRFARDLLGSGRPLLRSLLKLNVDNLSNLHPHPAYVFVYYSHPPLLDRIRALRE